MTDLAVVLISKNQDWNMARLIDSVLAGTAGLCTRQIVLVDSASTDKTIDIACSYPINIIRLEQNQQLCPAAGRYVGYQRTASELILFMDGDMELYKGWAEKALALIRFMPDVAVVTGQVIDIPLSGEPQDKVGLDQSHFGNSAVEVLHGGGAAMYRRSVLKQVGTFHPYIYSDEEPELCIRIRHAGYQVLSLEHPIAYHYSDRRDNLSTLVTRWRRNLYLGSGQNIRYHLGTELLWMYLKERGHGLIPGLGLLAGIISFLWALIAHQWQWFSLWLLLLGVIIAGDAYRKRSLRAVLSSLLKRMLILHGTVKGFLLKPLDPDTYPIRFDVVKWVS